MSTYENMINEIVRLRMALIVESMVGGCCPYAMYPLKEKTKICGTTSCRDCRQEWRKAKVQEVLEEVREEFKE